MFIRSLLRQQAGYTLDSLAVCHRANTERQKIQPHCLHVFGLWEELGVSGGKTSN